MEALTPGLEDYLEAIWIITLRDKVARVKDIAKHLGVTTPSVVNALSSLSEKNLVKHERYGYIELTNQGAAKAKEVDECHQLLFKLLHEILGVDHPIASQDACKIEHHVSDETIRKLNNLSNFLKNILKKKYFSPQDLNAL